MLQSVMPVPSRVLVPDVLPAVMPAVPAAPEFLPAAPAVPVLPSRVPADLPAPGREMLAAALAGPLPGAQRKAPAKTARPDDGMPLAWDDAEMKRFLGFLRSMSDRRDPQGRRLPLDYLTAEAKTDHASTATSREPAQSSPFTGVASDVPAPSPEEKNRRQRVGGGQAGQRTSRRSADPAAS